MHEVLMLTLAGLAGLPLGAIFFGGLWWTIRRLATSRRPALWLLASLLLRMSILLGGFYLVGREDWQRFLACMAGVLVARFLVIRLTRAPLPPASLQPQEARDAPYPR
ncbi:MAG: hypothetical protein OQK79_11125 [Rhodanobacter sp.]|nr:hypothetical protein [Rhodanobacter sp.]